MNDLIQNGLVLLVFILSGAYLIRKYFWQKSPKGKGKEKACGTSSCGCA